MSAHSNLSDQELAGLLRAGDADAFKLLYDRYWDKCYFVASKKLNSCSDAEESVQDIFLTLWQNREYFQLKENFDSYLAGAVKFQVIKRRAKRLRRLTIEQQLGIEANVVNLRSSAHSWNQYDLEVLQQRFSAAMDALPPKCKLVFMMSRHNEYANKKIASELGISEKAVEKHITHALKILKTKLGTYLALALILNKFL